MCQLIFQYREGFFLCSTPNKRHIFLCKLIERCNNGVKISHKTPIESSEAKKTPHLCDRFGLRPTLNSFNLGFINFNSHGVTTQPRKDTRSVQKVHFPRLPNKRASQHDSTTQVLYLRLREPYISYTKVRVSRPNIQVIQSYKPTAEVLCLGTDNQ